MQGSAAFRDWLGDDLIGSASGLGPGPNRKLLVYRRAAIDAQSTLQSNNN